MHPSASLPNRRVVCLAAASRIRERESADSSSRMLSAMQTLLVDGTRLILRLSFAS